MHALSVLYVADRWDGPYRWRCRHAVEQLRLDGVAANTMHVDDPALLTALPSYAVVVLFRLAWSARVAALVDAARRQGATLVFDIDDLIFDRGAERLLPFFDDLPFARQAEYVALFPRLRRTFDACDHFLGATPVLAAHAERLGKPGFVHPNLVSDGYVRAGRALGRVGRRLGRTPTIAYVSGSSTHDRDFRVVREPLARILADDPAIRLLLCGFVTLPWSLRRFRDRIVSLPYEDWRAYPFALATCRVALAPLATINDFTEGKSALKYLEAAAVGVPTVASPSAPFREAIGDDDTGFLATSEVEWLEKIRASLDDVRSRGLGERAQRDVRARFSYAAHRGELAGLFGRLGGRASGPPPPRLATDPDLRTGGAGPVRRARRRLGLARRQWALLRGRTPPGDRPTDRQAVTSPGPGAATPLEPARFDRLLAVVREHGPEWVRDGGPVVLDLTGGRGTWTPRGDAQPGAADGEYRSTGCDPQLLSQPLHLWKPPYRYVVVRMAARATGSRARGQLFWMADDASGFTESHSLRWTVELDDTLRSYVLDLHGTAWTQACAIHRLRLDPIDCPGQFRLETTALIADLAQLESDHDLRAALARRYLQGRGIECGALQNPLPAQPDARVFFVDRLTEAQARAHYPELDGQALARPALVGDVHRLPVRAGALDFCVANHLVEHAPDPIGALEELLRVIRPGGHLFVAVPDVVNPLDRHRPVTAFAHLLADHDPALDRRQEHLGHYREFVDSAHTEMNAADRDALLARWVEQDYSIHFHTFDEASYRGLLRHVADVADADVEEFVRNVGSDLDEHIAIVRRRRVPSGAVVRPAVTIVVVPSRASPDPRACLERVRRHASHDGRILVLDRDGGLEEALGRVGGGDVLLLRADARVMPGVVERLQAAAYGGDRPAIASALDVADVEAVGGSAGASIDEIAALVAAASVELRPELTAAATHCLYVPAAVLGRVRDVTGDGCDTVDELLERARACGYTIRLADDAFVPSAGSEAPSHGPAPGAPPADDPVGRAALAAVRRNLRRWSHRQAAGGPALLTLLHLPFDEPKGGTEHHVRDLLATLRLPRALVAAPRPDGIHVTEVFDGRLSDPVRYRFPLVEPPPALPLEHAGMDRGLRDIVRLFDVAAVHVQHFAGWPLATWRTLRELDLPYVLTCHDYYCVCPNLHLVRPLDGEPCCLADAGPRDCGSCLRDLFEARGLRPPDDPAEYAARHRRELGAALDGARRVIFPSRSARDVTARFHQIDPARACVIPHGFHRAPRRGAQRAAPRGPVRVALLGEVSGLLKGARNHLALMEQVRDLPIEWHVFGEADHLGFADALHALGIDDRLVLHGRYVRDTIVERLVEARIDLAVFLAPWPETFSYTLSEAFAAGVPVIVSAEGGALPERVQACGGGIVVGSVDEGRDALARLVTDREELGRLQAAVAGLEQRSLDDMAQDYRPLYETMLAGRPPAPPLDLVARRELFIAGEGGTRAANEAGMGGTPFPHYARWWYPFYLRVAAWTPAAVRRAGRRVVAARSWRPVRSWCFGEADAVQPNEGLELIRADGRTGVYRVLHASGAFELPLDPFPSRRVRLVRFELRCETRGPVSARVSWSHRGEEHFSDAKSVRIPLAANGGSWGEYAICIDDTGQGSLWDLGEQIARLRFDPLDAPGVVELRRLSLCEATR